MALAVMSGIGGGGIIVPLLMAFYDLHTKQAIAVSGFTILTGSLVRYAITLNERHPDKDATCVDYGLSNVMLPTILIGSITGVFFNIMLPSIILQALLTLLLGFLTYNSWLKARSIINKENIKFEEIRSAQASLKEQAENQGSNEDAKEGLIVVQEGENTVNLTQPGSNLSSQVGENVNVGAT